MKIAYNNNHTNCKKEPCVRLDYFFDCLFHQTSLTLDVFLK